ncbi:MAG: homoserine kinase, partial [Myxococcales bacterium]
MAIYTTLSLDDARRLAEPYGLDVIGCEGLIAGSVNSNHALTLADGTRVFARIYEEQDADGARDESALLDHLAGRGLPVARPMARGDGTTLTEHEGKPVALFPWVDGTMRCQATVSEGDAATVGAALARIHLAGSP